MTAMLYDSYRPADNMLVPSKYINQVHEQELIFGYRGKLVISLRGVMQPGQISYRLLVVGECDNPLVGYVGIQVDHLD